MRLLLIAHLISQKYFTGFGSQLADLGQVVDLSTLDGYENLISTRQMTDIMDNWRYNGKNYILPIYMNPVLFWWRGDLLKEQGFSEVPKTYDEVYALSENTPFQTNVMRYKLLLAVTGGTVGLIYCPLLCPK